MTIFKQIKPSSLSENPFKLIGRDWMLLTAGTPESFNTMTASWGGMGVLWNKNISIIFVRPQRYTFEFLEKAETYTLSFFPDGYREALNFCGSHSGRDTDKIARTGLTPRTTERNNVCFEEARIVMECRKIYFQDIDPSHFLDDSIAGNYPQSDYHRMYIGEIISLMTSE